MIKNVYLKTSMLLLSVSDVFTVRALILLTLNLNLQSMLLITVNFCFNFKFQNLNTYDIIERLKFT